MSELDEIRRDGGKPQKNSGRGWIQKGDATLYDICYDIKEYDESFSVSRKVWAKVCKDAWVSKKPIAALKLVLGSKTEKSKVRLWVISDEFFKELLECYYEGGPANNG